MKLELLPVTLYKHIAVLAMFPTMIDPLCVLMRRPSPLAGSPYVPASVPPMVPFGPNIARSGRHRPRFNYGRRRTYFYNYLCAHRKHTARKRGHDEFS
jgi:hypothetical protein